MRVGIGYDVHKLVEDRELILGGVCIPYEKGLLGHSDADVVVHAIMDALLGAAALGDIGMHFPDRDEKYKGVSSIKLLQYVRNMISQKSYKIENIDAVIIAQEPKLAPYIDRMNTNISKALGLSKNQVNIKATTEEGLGFTGLGQGMAAQAVVLINNVLNEKRRLHDLKSVDYNMLKWYFSFRHPETCENVILDSYLWKDYYDTRYYFNDRGLMWIFSNKDETFTNMPLCREEDLEECFYDVKDYFNNVLGLKLKLYLADEEAVKILNLPEDQFVVEEDRRYFDYIYDAEELKNLSGKKFHKKKNHVNGFMREYEGRYEFKILECDCTSEIIEFLNEWKETRDIEDEYNRVDYEVLGIQSVLKNCELIKFKIAGVYIDGKLEAFSMGSYSKEERMAYIHVEKANPNIKGLYAFINQQFIVHGFFDAIKVNREDDMGIEGLRKAKMSYQPIYLAKKYSIFEK